MGVRILVVEDDEFIRDVIAASLEDEGYHVDSAAGAREAWDLMAKCAPDLMLLDLALPEEDGLSICRKVRANPQFTELPVVFISAMTQPMYLQAAAQAGGNAFIKKPFDIDHVITTIARFVPMPTTNNGNESLRPIRAQEEGDALSV